MIVAWMLFAMEVSALLFAAAWLAERALLAARRPLRGVWVVAMLGANLLPLVLARVPLNSQFARQWALNIGDDSVLAKFGTPLLVLWGIAVAIGIFICASAVSRVSRTRPLWKNEHVDNTPVLVSHDVGPALVGVMQYSIVVPQWAYSLEEHARRLLLAHEREHARKFDPLLLTAAAFAVVIAPWNVFNWLFFQRLHLAVELDCDQRVLRAHPDAHGYGALLLDVAERVLPSVMPAAAFVEHGASLERRLNAMTEKKKSFKSLRVISGLAASLLLASAACVTPRPYAIVVVLPPAAAQGQQTAMAQPTVIMVEPKKQTAVVVESGKQAPVIVQQYAAAIEAANAQTDRAAASYAGPKEVWPVAPSARAKLLDDIDRARVRFNVLKESRSALGSSWSRTDSGLLFVMNTNGDLVKKTTVPRAKSRAGWDDVFSRTIMLPEVMGLRATSEIQIDRGINGELLQIPLRVFTAHLREGTAIPLLRAEVVPTREQMVDELRKRHPELLADTIESRNVGMLLYDTRGNLIKSAAITTDDGTKLPDGTINNNYENHAWRKAFGTVMDSGMVVINGTYTLFAGKPLREGPSRIMYVIMVRDWDIAAHMQTLLRDPQEPAYTAASSSKNGRSMDAATLASRLRELVQSRVPDAYGDWSRGDSAVMFLFDDRNELVARKAVAVPKRHGLSDLANAISHRLVSLPAEEIQAAGVQTIPTSSSGRLLEKPLVVVWGMLSSDASWSPGKN